MERIAINAMMLTNHLSNDADACITILEALGYDNIKHIRNKHELRFSRDEGQNPSAMRFNLQTLKFVCFSTNERGNIYSLVMKRKQVNFPQALHFIANKLGLEKREFNKKVKYPFSGFYRGLINEIQNPELTMETYSESILEDYANKYNLMFFNDGINFETQQAFNLGYDLWTLRITVPEYTLDGKLCGIMGRLNDPDCPKEERWLPIIPCSRSLTLYGYHQNYEMIQSKGLAVIGESEKFVQQMHSMGSQVGLATCGCDISDIQARYIKGLLTPKIVLAYDEGLEEERIRVQAEKLKLDNALYANRVGYIYDKENSILPKGSKASPTDLGADRFKELMKNHVVWL